MKHNAEQQKDLEMYFSFEVAERFAELEQNEKNFNVAEIIDKVLIKELKNIVPIFSAELGGGAHPDRYHIFFKKILQEPQGHIDWVDISPHMLKLAEKYIKNEEYQERQKVITFIKNDILKYLESLDNNKLDVAIMKYTIDHITDLDILFKLLSQKLKKGGKLISTFASSSELISYSTNARFLYKGEQFPDNETRTLKDGDSFTVKFFNVSGEPNSGYLKGAETTKYYHSIEKVNQLAKKYNFNIFVGDWKDFIKKEDQGGEILDQDILILTKN